MRMFIAMDAIQPMCEEVGFEEVFIDMSNTKMQFEVEEGEEGKTERA